LQRDVSAATRAVIQGATSTVRTIHTSSTSRCFSLAITAHKRRLWALHHRRAKGRNVGHTRRTGRCLVGELPSNRSGKGLLAQGHPGGCQWGSGRIMKIGFLQCAVELRSVVKGAAFRRLTHIGCRRLLATVRTSLERHDAITQEARMTTLGQVAARSADEHARARELCPTCISAEVMDFRFGRWELFLDARHSAPPLSLSAKKGQNRLD